MTAMTAGAGPLAMGNVHAGNPNGGNGQVMLILKVIGSLLTAALIVVSAVGAYWQIVGKIDLIQERMVTQAKQLDTLSESLKGLADRAATMDAVDARIERACLQMAIANQGKGWVCPFSVADVVAPRPPRRVTVKQVKVP